ncbi:Neuronal calcium sensor 2 [Brachionus plicatilis]|uniref:Neuronal calcium sensor 2 n=1 Tax=Brachionus plicatilis TaxID=10195 RepID=A0A3M7S7Q5_BRAPC|nr:Neuronal calcium sensor 2 [Brachionus plicatilis]
MGNKGGKNKPSKKKGDQKISKGLSESDYGYLTSQTGYSRPEIKLFYDQFMNNNPDGKLDRQEFARLYSKLRAEPPELLDEISNFVFRAFDDDNNGYISFNEFMIAYALTSRGDPKKKLEYAFELYDADNNGTLDMNEVRSVLVGMLDLLGADKRATNVSQLTEECCSQLDKSGDGKISKEEFIEGLLKNYSLRALMSPFN